jgi:hypothetical protein
MNGLIQESILRSKVDCRLQRIANMLLLNASFTDNLGLLNGKMGIAIFFYQYSRYTKNKIFEDFAGELIDEIYEEINTNTPADFTNGLTGIGWGIEYLVKNGFIEADTDEALSDIDNSIYRSMFSRPFLLENSNDLFGYGFYYIMRLGARGIDDESLTTLIKKQHLMHLTEYTDRLFVKKEFPDFHCQSLSIDTINSFIWFLLEIYRIGLSPGKVKKVFHFLPEYIEACLQDSENKPEQFLLLLLTENIIASVTDKGLQKKYMTILRKKNGTGCKMEISDEALVDNSLKNTLQKLVYAQYITEGKLFHEDADKLFSIIESEENWTFRIDKLNKDNLGLTGFAGLGWGLLRLKDFLKNY